MNILKRIVEFKLAISTLIEYKNSFYLELIQRSEEHEDKGAVLTS